MTINNTEIILMLRITDLDNGNEVFEISFDNFDELNEGLKNPSFEEPLDSEIVLEVCKKTEDQVTILFGYYISYMELDEDEIEEYMSDIRDFLKPGGVQLTPKISHDHRKQGSNKELSRYQYVCPSCYETIENCNCKSYPYYLVQIDKNMLPIVKDLNLKGYHTASSCEGHIEDSVRCTQIIFQKKYKFPLPFPEGGNYDAMADLSYFYPECDDGEFQIRQQQILDDLREWSFQLPMNIE